jgi:hypothetical protein
MVVGGDFVGVLIYRIAGSLRRISIRLHNTEMKKAAKSLCDSSICPYGFEHAFE